MHILIHDFAGHAFPIQLTRSLAGRGFKVTHVYCASLTSTPQGSLAPSTSDPAGLSIMPITLDRPIRKDRFLDRFRLERAYGQRLREVILRERPDIFVSGNSPLDAQKAGQRAAERVGARTVFWVQDLIGIATERLLGQKIPLLGKYIGAHYRRLESTLLAEADQILLITEDFKSALPPLRSEPAVLPNWAPIEDLPVLSRTNSWSIEKNLSERPRLLYSGTLGMKHNPDILYQLAKATPEADVIVISVGVGAEWLRSRPLLENLRILPFQPFDRLPEVLASADVLLTILEPDAGVYSVPSKVLSYLCAGRAQLLGVPPENGAARMVTEAGCGVCVDPEDARAFVQGAARLLQAPQEREHMGQAARQYAESHFDIDRITDSFVEAIGIK
ncbi:hypothetical protein BH23BAC4_BH23BAC4_17890 [soil metagenome]